MLVTFLVTTNSYTGDEYDIPKAAAQCRGVLNMLSNADTLQLGYDVYNIA